MIRSVSRFFAAALSLCFAVPALAQVQPGQSPLSGSKGGTGNAFMQFTGPASPIKSYTLPNASDTIATLGAIQTFTAAKTFNDGTLKLNGSSSGAGTIKAPAAASTYVWTLPAATGTLAYTGNHLGVFAATTSAQLRAVLSDETGTGVAYFQGGNLGTPSAGILTNATGLPTAGLIDNAVTNAKMATMTTGTFKGNVSGSTAAPSDLTATQVTAALNAVVGDSGSGGTKGLVPAPSAGDAAGGKYLKADGTWAVPPGGGGGTVTFARSFMLPL